MKKRFFILIFFLVLTFECLGMDPIHSLRPEKGFAMVFNDVAPPYVLWHKQLLDLIFEYTLVLVLIQNTIPTENKVYNQELTLLAITPNFRVIDLKFFLSRQLLIPTQGFNMCFAKGKSVENNPLAFVVDRIPAHKKIVIKSGRPVKPIPYRSCLHCLHTVASSSGRKTFVLPNRFEHTLECSKRPALKKKA